MKRARTKIKQSTEEYISVHIHRTDNISDWLQKKLIVRVSLLDLNSGKPLVKLPSTKNEEKDVVEPVSTKMFNFKEKRSLVPFWNETLVIDEDINVLEESKPAKVFLFDVQEQIQNRPRSAFNLTRRPAEESKRCAWAFLKPIGSDGSLNIYKEVRLQLYKVRKNCKTSHNLCEVFHLYSEHTLKKYPGSLFVTIKGVKPTSLESVSQLQTHQNQSMNSTNLNSVFPASTESQLPKFETYEWSRLPSQSCKIPNMKLAELRTGKNRVNCIKFSRDGQMIACGTQSRVFIFNGLTGQELYCYQGHTGLIYDIDWQSNDDVIVSASADCTASLWQIRPFHSLPLHVLPHPSFVYTSRFLIFEHALITGCKDHVIRFWVKQKQTYELIQELSGHHGFVSALYTHKTLLFSGDSCGYLFIWSWSEEWTCMKKFLFPQMEKHVIDALILHPGERRLLVTVRGKGLFMIDIGSGLIIQKYRGLVNMCSRCVSSLSPCGSLLFAFGQNNTVVVWQVETGKHLATYSTLFGIATGCTEASGYIDYHPFEHLAAFALFGENYSPVLVKFDRYKNNNIQLGLSLSGEHTGVTVKGEDSINKEMKHALKGRLSPVKHEIGSEEKLERVIRTIDNILLSNRVVKQFSIEASKEK